MLPTTPALGATAVGWATSGQLRASTREEHLASEAALDLGSLDTLDAFAGLLRGWAAVWRSVWLASHASAACSTARAELRGPAEQALDLLTTDLTEVTDLSHSGERPSPVCSMPAVRLGPGLSGRDLGSRFFDLLEEPGTSWGVAYVLLGSRLGGAVLAPVLSGAVGLPAGVGTSFLRSDGIDSGREWVGFRRRLDSFPLSRDQLAIAVDAARWTFARVGTELAARRRDHQVAS